MKKGKKILNIAIYVFLAMLLWFQVMGIIAVQWGPAIFGTGLPDVLREARWFVPLWIFNTILIGTAVTLCKVWRKKETRNLIPMVMGIFGAVFALIIALTLRAALPLQAAANNVSTDGAQGLTDWSLFWRHYSVILVGVVTAVVSFLNFKFVRDERVRKENESYQDHFVLDGEPLFADESKKKK